MQCFASIIGEKLRYNRVMSYRHKKMYTEMYSSHPTSGPSQYKNVVLPVCEFPSWDKMVSRPSLLYDRYCIKVPLIARFMGHYGAHLGPTGPRWAPCWPMNFAIWGRLSSVMIPIIKIRLPQDRHIFTIESIHGKAVFIMNQRQYQVYQSGDISY